MTQYVQFLLDEKSFGIDISSVESIEFFQPTTHIPGAEPYVRGLLHLRNQLIPVVDMRVFFHLPSLEDAEASRILICSCMKEHMGLLVDSIPDVIEIASDKIQPVTETFGEIPPAYLEGTVELNKNNTIGIFNLPLLIEEIRKSHTGVSKFTQW